MKKCLLHIAFLVIAMMLSFSMSGQAVVTGAVFEQDSIVPISGADIVFSGISETGDTLQYQFISDSVGFYEADIEAGMYCIWASAVGYETSFYADSLWIETDSTVMEGVNFILYEIPYPVHYVAARHFVGDLVRISWSMHEPQLFEDFETGDFSQFSWDNSISDFPWLISSDQAFEGQYGMKSACEGQENGLSEIEVSVYIPLAGQVSFYSKISSEASWDVGMFSLDGVKLMECSGMGDWEKHCFDISEGEHTFRWSYRKDASTNEGDDCFYVDCIHFHQESDTTEKVAPRSDRSFQYFDLYRSRFDEAPVMLASHLADTVFMEMNWNSLPWGKYRWGVSCYYEGNRSVSDTVWSAFLDKDMTTTFELVATTNVGLTPVGATVELVSINDEGYSYNALLDAEGHVMLTGVYRDDYQLRVHLEGYVDYVSTEPISVFASTQFEIELEEKVMPINSLYVSSTGWAVWELYDRQNFDLQYFELMLDEDFIGTTTQSFFQFDVEMLEAGEHHEAKVRPVYLSEASDWIAYEWTYRPCSDFPSSDHGLEWSLQDEALMLSWKYPENDSVMGAVLYRNGFYLAYTDADFYLDETADLQNDTEYCVRLVYGGSLDGAYYSMSCEECVWVTFPEYCAPPVKLDAENYWVNDSDFGALISWGERPEPIFQWLQYDDGVYLNSVGNNGEPMFWGIRFAAEDLIDYQGTELKKITLFDAGAGSYQLWIYVGGDEAPRTMVRFYEMALSGSYSWHEQIISPAFEIPENEPVWIVIGQQGLSRPAAACADMGNSDGRWASLNGTEWHDLHYYNLHYTWMLRAFVSNRAGKMQPMGKEGFMLHHYNLYRSYNNVDYQQITTIPAVEGQAYYQYKDVLVGMPNNRFYFRLTALYRSDEGEECESDFAASLDHPDSNYVMVDNHWQTTENELETLKIYPNPTSGQLRIESNSIQKVSVFNVFGQCILDWEGGSDVLQLDFSDCENGVYWVKVTSENGVQTRAFVLSR